MTGLVDRLDRLDRLVDTRPARLRHPLVLVFGSWNALVWLGRVRNIVSDDGLSGGSKALWMVPALVFGVGGAVAVGAWWKAGTSAQAPRWALAVAAVATASLLYWPIRTMAMLFASHGAAFVLVHLVLAVVSMLLAGAVLRRLALRS